MSEPEGRGAAWAEERSDEGRRHLEAPRRLSGKTLRVPPAVMRLGAKQLGRRCLDAALPWPVQRTRLNQLTSLALMPRGTTVGEQTVGGVGAEVVTARTARPPVTVVHFHGGGYCVGSARTARSWAAHLSAAAGCQIGRAHV